MLSPSKPMAMAPLNPNAPVYLPVCSFPPPSPTTLFTFSSHSPFPSPSSAFYCPPAPYQYYHCLPPPPLPPPAYQPPLCVYYGSNWLHYTTCRGVRGKVVPLHTEDVGFLPSLTTANFFSPVPPREEPVGSVLSPPPVYKVQIEKGELSPRSGSSPDEVKRVGSKASGWFFRKGRGGSYTRGEKGFHRLGYACYRKMMWIPKLRNQMRKASRDGNSHEEFEFQEVGEQGQGEEHGECGKEGKTTVMIKNIPNKFTKEMLLELLDRHCIEENQKLLVLEDENKEHMISEFDFFYLPMDFVSGSNLGYAFVNFTSSAAAWRLHHAFHKKAWSGYVSSRKVCEVTYARIQGLGALVSHFKNSSFACDSDEYLPVYFVPHRDGLCVWEQRCIGKRIPKPDGLA